MTINGIKTPTLLVVILLQCACAMGPLSDHGGAQTSGDGKFSHNTSILPVVSHNIAYGLSERTDIGGGLELQLAPVFTLWLKHKLHESDQNVVSLEGGVIYSPSQYGPASGQARGMFAGALWSQKNKRWAPYASMRLNYIHWDHSFTTEDTDTFECEVLCLDSYNGVDTSYGQILAGMRYKPSKHFSLSMGAMAFLSDEDITPLIPTFGLRWNLK